MSARKAMCLLMLCLLASTAHASRSNGAARIDPDQPVPAQLGAVEAMLEHEDYSEIGTEGRGQVHQALASIRRTMGNRTELDQLNPNERIEVLNQQEVINTTMNRAHADSRMVCERYKPIGSNRPTRVCQTVADRRRAREASERMMQEGNARQQPFDPLKGGL